MSKSVTSLHSQSCLQLEQGTCVKLSKPNGSAMDFKERALVIQSRFGGESTLVAIVGTAVTSAFQDQEVVVVVVPVVDGTWVQGCWTGSLSWGILCWMVVGTSFEALCHNTGCDLSFCPDFLVLADSLSLFLQTSQQLSVTQYPFTNSLSPQFSECQLLLLLATNKPITMNPGWMSGWMGGSSMDELGLHGNSVLEYKVPQGSRWLSGQESTCQCRRRGFSPWVG